MKTRERDCWNTLTPQYQNPMKSLVSELHIQHQGKLDWPQTPLFLNQFMVTYPADQEIEMHANQLRRALRVAGVPAKVVTGISTKAFRTGRKVTGQHATNRESRWKIPPTHPQYGSERDCRIIFVKLCAQLFCFDNAPALLNDELRSALEAGYLGHPIAPGGYKDKLLLERFDFKDLVAEGFSPTHGHSDFHIGHEDPSIHPKHQPDNIGWRTSRSNLIQGDLTLREARIYFLKLIGRYFELGELDIN